MKFEDCEFCIHFRGSEEQEDVETCQECEVGENFEEDDELDLETARGKAA